MGHLLSKIQEDEPEEFSKIIFFTVCENAKVPRYSIHILEYNGIDIKSSLYIVEV